MNLVTRFLAARRDKLLMKLGCWLVCFSLVLGLMLPQQRAEALVAELSMTAVAGVAAAYLCACGLPFVTQGMDKDALVSSVQRLIQEFLDTELGGISIMDWLGGVWDLVFTGGKLVLGRMLTDKLMEFAQWVVQTYAVAPGVNQIYASMEGFFSFHAERTLSNGKVFLVVDYPQSLTYFGRSAVSNGEHWFLSAFIPEDVQLVWCKPKQPISGEFWMVESVSSGGASVGLIKETEFAEWYLFEISSSSYLGVTFTWCGLTQSNLPSSTVFSIDNTYSWIKYADAVDAVGSLSVDRAPSMSYIPEGIAAEQGIALDVGAAATMDLDQVLQGVLDGVLEGTLTATMAAAGEAVENPPAEEIPDVDNLGLPALGQALTSRFPFSIPWDFFRAVQLLAAPAKAPYFEVDFMEPLADDVGGWKGDTTVILDFSEYAIIGQISRWTSTIGFCLMLAGATKRLIWTA